jgi:hypothetical protein
MSRLNRKDNSTYGNTNTHIFTEFSTLAKETTQKELLEAIKDINIDVGQIVVGDITVESSDTITHTKLDTANGKLDTLNTTIINKHLTTTDDSVTIGDVLEGVSIGINNYPAIQTIDGSVNVLNFPFTQTVDGSVLIPDLNFSKDTVNVVSPVQSVIYDLNILADTMYADSINSAIVDPYGREGWYWTNNATTGGSNCYWYSNTLVAQNNMSKGGMECVYVILALDRVHPAIVLPFLAMYSTPTGSDDVIPGFAHSRWVYTIPATHYLNAGEVVMLTIGDHTKVANIQPELRRIHLVLTTSNGQADDAEIINYVSLNTDSASKELGGIQYLLKNAGFYYNETDKTVQYEFLNSLERLKQLNLARNNINVAVSNSPTNYATETGGNLASIKTNTDKIKSDSVNTDAIQVQVKNSSIPVSGSVTVNTISGFSTETTLQSTNTKLDTINTSINNKNFNYTTDSVSIGFINNGVSVDSVLFGNNGGSIIPIAVTSTGILKTEVQNTSFEVSSLPDITIENTSFEVSNFPASFEISNFPTTVEVTSLPDIAITNTSFEISNFPTTTEVSNFPASFEVSNFPTTVEVTSLPDIAITNTSFEISNFPTTTEVSNFPASFEVSNFPTTVEVTSLPDIAITNTSFEVSNFPTTYALETGGNLASIKSNTDKIKSDTTNADAIQVQVKNTSLTVGGTVSISNSFSLDATTQSTNTKLDTIHTDLDGLTFDGSSNLNVNVNAGSITVDSVKIKASNGDNITAIEGSINSNITNSSIDTHIKAFHSGSWLDVASASNGHLLVNSSTQDGNGNDITSSNLGGGVQALDVNIRNNSEPVIIDFANPSIGVTGSVSIDNLPSVQSISGDVNITNTSIAVSNSFTLDTTTQSTNTKLDTIHTDLDGLTFDGSSNLNVNVNAGSITVDSVKIKASNGDSITATGGSINSNITNTVPVSGTISARISDTAGNSVGTTFQSLQTFDYNINSAMDGTTIKTLGVSKNGASYVNNSSTTNFNSQSGLNVYAINPKAEHYTIGGFDPNNVANIIVSADATAPGILQTTYSFGTANPREHWAVLVSPGINTLVFQYIDASGNISQVDSAALSGTPVSLGSFVSLLWFRLTNAITGTQKLQIGLASDIANLRATSLYSEDLNQKCHAVFTIPNGYIGYISNLVSNVPITTNVNINKWTAAGVRSTVWRATNASNMYLSSGYEGTLGGIFNPGETIAFGIQSQAGGKSVFANLVLKAIN